MIIVLFHNKYIIHLLPVDVHEWCVPQYVQIYTDVPYLKTGNCNWKFYLISWKKKE